MNEFINSFPKRSAAMLDLETLIILNELGSLSYLFELKIIFIHFEVMSTLFINIASTTKELLCFDAVIGHRNQENHIFSSQYNLAVFYHNKQSFF